MITLNLKKLEIHILPLMLDFFSSVNASLCAIFYTGIYK
jgi:hypothetical protein